MGLSFWHLLVVVLVVLILFGGGKLPRLMGDLAEGIKAFKKGMRDDEPHKELPKKEDKDGVQ